MIDKPYVDTALESFRCLCPRGHTFWTKVIVAINIDTDSQMLEQMSDDGIQQVGCPKCEQFVQIAHPVIVHTKEYSQYLLYIPKVLIHLHKMLIAKLQMAISQKRNLEFEEYIFQFSIVTNKNQILDRCTGSFVTGGAKKRPQLHKAFEDLASIVPSAPSGEKEGDG